MAFPIVYTSTFILLSRENLNETISCTPHIYDSGKLESKYRNMPLQVKPKACAYLYNLLALWVFRFFIFYSAGQHNTTNLLAPEPDPLRANGHVNHDQGA